MVSGAAKDMIARDINEMTPPKRQQFANFNPWTYSVAKEKGRRKRHCAMDDSSSSRGSNLQPIGVTAGQDLPANVVEGPVHVMPKLGLDLLSHDRDHGKASGSSTQIIYDGGKLETEQGERLSLMVSSMRSAGDRHEQNMELVRDEENSAVFCVRTLKPIRCGRPLLIWYGEELARELGVPILTPANIRGNQQYICTGCHSTFAQPNLLKAHLFFECSRHSTHQSRNQSTLVPFHALLENISSGFTLSSAKTPNRCNKHESDHHKHCKSKQPIFGEILVKDICEGSDGDRSVNVNTKSEHYRISQKLHCLHLEQPKMSPCSTAEVTQSDLSPSLSSSSSLDSSSFVDEIEDDDSTVNSHNINQPLHQKDNIIHSAFHRPTKTPKGISTSEDAIAQTPDSSTDQRSALNLSVKEDGYTLLSSPVDGHNNFLSQSLNHQWPNPRNTSTHPHIVPYPINYTTIPMYYPTTNTNAVPSASLNYMAYYNQCQVPRTLNVRRQCFESHNVQNTDIPLPRKPSPKTEHNNMSRMAFSTPESCPPIDNAVAPINPYGISLPSDKEPLDLLPQTYFTNKSKRGHLCLYCGKLYSRKYGLKIHMRTHNGYKPLKCKICSRPFGDPSNLNKHVRLHAQGETPYRCDYCGKVLVRRRDLERHVRSRHPMGSLHIDTSSPPSSPISVDDIDPPSLHENASAL